MNQHEFLSGVILDEHLTLTLHEVCEVCGIEEALVVEMVKEGIAAPLDEDQSLWEFTGIAVSRLRTAHRLQRDLHVNLAGAALAIDLLEEIASLRSVRARR
jgi:chaperone modulatory protein CbpM